LAGVFRVTQPAAQATPPTLSPALDRAQEATMLTARLLTSIGPRDLPIGPVEYLQTVGKFLKLPDGTDLAIHQGGMWMAEGFGYISLDFDCRVNLEFSHTELPEREAFGPFSTLRIIDGSIWAGKPPELLARFDDALSAWHIYTRPAAAMNVLTIRRAD
jgi:hypothetical protein